jgi:uncharacterized protein
MRFAWDPLKAELNKRRGKPTFEEGAEACDDPNAFIQFDAVHSEDEDRYQLIGLAANGILLVVFTTRDNDNVMWLISVRRASPKERRDYYENNPR